MVRRKNRSWISARPAKKGTANSTATMPSAAIAAMREVRVWVAMR